VGAAEDLVSGVVVSGFADAAGDTVVFAGASVFVAAESASPLPQPVKQPTATTQLRIPSTSLFFILFPPHKSSIFIFNRQRCLLNMKLF
jgi:hypothetical protein